jgi:predicted protein tyrosine phosphatase
MIKKIIVVPRLIIEDYIKEDSADYWNNWALISISTSEEEIVANKDILLHKGCIDYIECVFADITKKEQEEFRMDHLEVFSEKTAKKIIGFIDRIKDNVDILVVHCDAGVSRSGAVGVFACRYLKLDEKEFRRQNSVLPNMYVLQVLNEASGQTDDYQAFWEKKLNIALTKNIKFKDKE